VIFPNNRPEYSVVPSRLIEYKFSFNAGYQYFLLMWCSLKYYLVRNLFLGAFEKLWKAPISFVISVRKSDRLSAWDHSTLTVKVFMKFDIWWFFGNLSRKLKFCWNLKGITDTLHSDLYRLMIMFRWILLRMRNISDKSCRANNRAILSK